MKLGLENLEEVQNEPENQKAMTKSENFTIALVVRILHSLYQNQHGKPLKPKCYDLFLMQSRNTFMLSR